MPSISRIILLTALALILVACKQEEQGLATNTNPSDWTDIAPDSAQESPRPAAAEKSPGKFLLTAAEQGLPPELAPLTLAWTGDLDGMEKRRVIRVLTVYQLGGYFLDGPQEKGMTYDLVKMFETFLNERRKTGHLKIHVVMIPVEFDQLLEGLKQGYGDIAAAGLSITDDRDQVVDFSQPLSREVKEVIISGPASPVIGTLDDLAGKQVYARPGSSYLESLAALSEDFRNRGLDPIDAREAPPLLEDVELLEMVEAGLLPLIVMDDFKARFWVKIFENLQVREDLVIQSGRQIAWAFRQDSPLLAAELNEFISAHRQGTLMGNILIKRYLKDTKWARNALDPSELGRFQETIKLFEQYAGEYGFDYLMIAAQGYQESRLDQSARSSAGAIGIMQLLASTAADRNVGIANIETAESNIHAGIKYMRFLRDRYFDDPALDDFNAALFSLAAYNAGPGRVRGLRKKAEEAGLDPNKWFNNVELVAAKEIGRETVQYVSNIYKYYLAYRLITNKQEEQSKQ